MRQTVPHIPYSWGKTYISQTHWETAKGKQKVNKEESQWNPIFFSFLKLRGTESRLFFLLFPGENKNSFYHPLSPSN